MTGEPALASVGEILAALNIRAVASLWPASSGGRRSGVEVCVGHGSGLAPGLAGSERGQAGVFDHGGRAIEVEHGGYRHRGQSRAAPLERTLALDVDRARLVGRG
jgi:hypothetical protein